MKRPALIVALVGFLALPALALQQPQRPNAQAQQQNQIQNNVADVYVFDFRMALELSDEQFFKLNPLIRRYIMMRFNLAARSLAADQQLERLSSQPNPSDEEVRTLIAEKTQVDRTMGNMESQLLERIRMEVDLSTTQLLAFYGFQKRFFDEKLPKVIEQARAAAAQRGQPPPLARPNLNNRQSQPQNNPARPGKAILPQKN